MDDRHVMRLIKAAERMATATEQIAATLQRMADNDPLDAISKALEAEIKETPQVQPVQSYGADLPESERWRLGS